MVQFNARQFTWDKNNASADASDLEGFRPGANFKLKSPRTDSVVTIYFENTLMQGGERVGWKYYSYTQNVHGPYMHVTVYND